MGIDFTDLTKMREGAMKVREWGKNAPTWRRVKNGLCIEGQCRTRSCNAYQKTVICNWGIGKEFDLGTHSKYVECPICQQHVNPTTCAFNNCDWTFRGKKWTSYEEGEQRVSEGPFTAGDAYHLFDDKVQTRWCKLKIQTAREGELVKNKSSRTG